MVNKDTNKEDSILLEENENLVVEGTDNQKEAKEEVKKSAARTEQNLTNTDVANAQNLQYEQNKIQELRNSGEWYKKSRQEKKQIRREIEKAELERQKKERES